MSNSKKYLVLSRVSVFLLAFSSQLIAATFLVGPSRTYKVPSAVAGLVHSRDTVLIDTGTYVGDVAAWTVDSLVLKGVNKYAHLKGCGSRCKNDKAIWVIDGKNTTIENIEFSDAAIADALGANGAGIRQEAANVTIRNCYFHDCQDGILTNADLSSAIVIENSEFARCGLDPCPSGGCVHNMYIGEVGEFTLKGCYTHSAAAGHTIKSRARKNYILYNRIMSLQSTTSYEINLPNGGTSFIIGNVIEQGPNSQNSTIVDYGSEGLANHDSALYVVNNTIVNDKSSGTFISISNTQKPARVINNLFVGAGTLYKGPMDTTSNLKTDNPGFVDKLNYDYHLTSTSPAINQGIAPGSVGTLSLVPTFQYADPTSTQVRTIVGGTIDAGAYEFSATGIANQPHKLASYKTLQAIMIGSTSDYDLQGRLLPDRKTPTGKMAGKIGPVMEVR